MESIAGSTCKVVRSIGSNESFKSDCANPEYENVEKNRVSNRITIFFTKQFLFLTKIKKPQDYLLELGLLKSGNDILSHM